MNKIFWGTSFAEITVALSLVQSQQETGDYAWLKQKCIFNIATKLH